MIGSLWIELPDTGNLVDLNSLRYLYKDDLSSDMYVIRGNYQTKVDTSLSIKFSTKEERDEYWDKIKQLIVNTI